eukprot:5131379-Amphidinium_carterae.1
MAWVMSFLQGDTEEAHRPAEVVATKGSLYGQPVASEEEEINFTYRHHGRDGRRSKTFHTAIRDGSAVPWNPTAEQGMQGHGFVLSMQKGALAGYGSQSFPNQNQTGSQRSQSWVMPRYPVLSSSTKEAPVNVTEHREQFNTCSFIASVAAATIVNELPEESPKMVACSGGSFMLPSSLMPT